MLAHADRDRTYAALLDARLWWKGMWQDIQSTLKTCLSCAQAKTKPYVTSHQRSRDYDGPFRYLIIDFVGPISPITSRGNKYVFTCACAWSGWYWVIATTDDKSETAASLLFERIMCDIAGYPVCIGSDRAITFVESVIKDLLKLFPTRHVVGTAYHPQAQSAVERPHRDYNMMCRTFCDTVTDWDLVCPIFQWSVRTTAKVYSANYTPYEIITGLKPRNPIEYLLGSPNAVEKIPVTDYVRDLVKYVKQVHIIVEQEHQRIREGQNAQALREQAVGPILSVGDYVMVYRPADKEVGRRLQTRTFDEVFQVVATHGEGRDARTFTLCDLQGRRENLGFSQPVALERLVPVDIAPRLQSSDHAEKLIINDRGREREATIQAQSLDGKVLIRYDDEEIDHWIDLTLTTYRWV